MEKLSKIYQELINEDLEYVHVTDAGPESDCFEIGSELFESNDLSEFRFNDGKFNKNGANTIYMGDNPIIDFIVGQIGNVNINGVSINNALEIGNYGASVERMGYGKLGIEFIFSKLPKIQYIVFECLDSAKPFWDKMGGKVLKTQEYSTSGKMLYTMAIKR